MRILVTRPRGQAEGWVARLNEQGLPAAALPLIAIEPALDTAPLQQAWHQLARWRLVMFVSGNAVEQFFAQRPTGSTAQAWPSGVTAASPGPGTTQALQRFGVPAGQIVAPADDAPQFDSESLWARLQLHDWRGARALFVRGEAGRDWLAEALRGAGAEIDVVAAYRRCMPSWDEAERALAQAAVATPAAHLWWFTSAQAIDHLQRLGEAALPGADWSAARAVTTHPRIEARARRLGFGQVTLAHPSFDSVLAALGASIQSAPP